MSKLKWINRKCSWFTDWNSGRFSITRYKKYMTRYNKEYPYQVTENSQYMGDFKALRDAKRFCESVK